ncbi:hypothetical protein D9C73_020304 [Collichthys lucidus]|uniref:Uncharacterized protein n=1 Tax=Collichthys lucidus TaxID=240159 RepID=A0A4U5VDI0_COLLU|nr:hypothetical protein D9C73_020304 [Collichthys lucidus]
MSCLQAKQDLKQVVQRPVTPKHGNSPPPATSHNAKYNCLAEEKLQPNVTKSDIWLDSQATGQESPLCQMPSCHTHTGTTCAARATPIVMDVVRGSAHRQGTRAAGLEDSGSELGGLMKMVWDTDTEPLHRSLVSTALCM